ncbi:MAG: FMN-binding protein [Planctomycetes bacterium]|nr:FMN-binding protein [Planctomycetota bacterium]
MSNSIKLFFRESWLLMVSAVFFGALLAVANAAWAPKIAQNEINKFSNLAKALLPEAMKFEPLQNKDKIIIDLGDGKTAGADVRKGLDAAGNCIGWAFLAEGSGFADKIKLVVTADAGFTKLNGFGVQQCSETPGFGDKITIKNGFYQAQYKQAPAGKFTLTKIGDSKKIDSEIVAITGATVTSQAVVNIMNTYVVQIKQQLQQKKLIGQ